MRLTGISTRKFFSNEQPNNRLSSLAPRKQTIGLSRSAFRSRNLVARVGTYLWPAAICLMWFVPPTCFGSWTAPVGTRDLALARFPILAFGLVPLFLARRKKVSSSVLAMLFILLAASLGSSRQLFSLSKMAGLGAVVLSFAPAIRSPFARRFRARVWTCLCWGAVLVSLISAFWPLSGLASPTHFRGIGYAGITNQSMLLGPLAGIAATVIFAKGMAEGRLWWVIPSAICFLMCLATLSRSAIVATSVGLVAVLFLATSNRASLFVRFGALGLVSIMAVGVMVIPKEYLPMGVGSENAFAVKGLDNTREILWHARWTDFLTNPLLGTGVGVSMGYGGFRKVGEGDFSGNVEPGSSYLAVLAMSGASGGLALAFVLVAQLIMLGRSWAQISLRRRLEIAGVGSLLAVHGIAEGWIYGPGDLICVFFWLWLGITRDAADKTGGPRSAQVTDEVPK